MRDGRTKPKETHRKTQALDSGAVVAAGGDCCGRGSARGLRGVGNGAVLVRGVAADRSVRPAACARLPEAGPPGLSGSRPGGVGRARRRLGGGPARSAARRRPGDTDLSSGLGGGVAAHAAAPRPGIRPIVTAAGAREVSRAVPVTVVTPPSPVGSGPPADDRPAAQQGGVVPSRPARFRPPAVGLPAARAGALTREPR